MRLRFVAALALMGLIAAGVAVPALAQETPMAPPESGASGPGQRGDRMGQGPNLEQMIDNMAQRMGLTDAEKAATKKAMRAKNEAATPLGQELRKLREISRNRQATDRQISAALKSFDKALAVYRQKVKAIEKQLIGAVSLRARAALTAMGIIDNGMGGMGFGGRGGPGAGFGGGRRQRNGDGSTSGSSGSGQGVQGPQVIR